MAKQRKSSVKRELPSIEETTKAVEKLTKDVHSLKDKTTKAVNEYNPNQYPPIEQRGKGRPKATHGKKRFTTLLEKESIEMVKVISSVTGLEQNEIYSEAVQDYIEKFKKAYPTKYKLVQATLKVKYK